MQIKPFYLDLVIGCVLYELANFIIMSLSPNSEFFNLKSTASSLSKKMFHSRCNIKLMHPNNPNLLKVTQKRIICRHAYRFTEPRLKITALYSLSKTLNKCFVYLGAIQMICVTREQGWATLLASRATLETS